MSPEYIGIRYTLAVDIVDVTNTVLPGDDLALRTHVGMEIGIGIHSDGTALFSILGGYNANHPSIGVLARDWIFEVGFGRYTVELEPNLGTILTPATCSFSVSNSRRGPALQPRPALPADTVTAYGNPDIAMQSQVCVTRKAPLAPISIAQPDS